MSNRITKEEALKFKKRWEMVNEAERQELRKTTAKQKLQQLAVLMGWVDDFRWGSALKAEEIEVREVWIKLKRLCHV